MLFLPVISQIFGSLTKKEEGFNPLRVLNEAGIGAPKAGIDTTPERPHACYKLRSLLLTSRDRNEKCPVTGSWHQAHLETVAEEQVRLVDMIGCTSSRNSISSFAHMPGHPDSLARINFYIERFGHQPDVLAYKIFDEGFGEAVACGGLMKVVREEWSGKQFIANDGGGHRLAALAAIDREYGYKRPFIAKVTTHSLSPEFRQQCRENSIWFFTPNDATQLYEKKAEFAAQGLQLVKLPPTAENGPTKDWVLLIPKTHPHHALIGATLMREAFSLSEWVEKAYAGPKKNAAPLPGGVTYLSLV